ncbi:tRNA (uridine(34)/cytosine(34)/5-carboxymethylaminomethyluridine(34)-2'-O)-methyltransferase TrmL [Haliea sp. E1-2-M8]|uniref:tRNA (uridine(34)/cytosine(34)/5- carboxymethylaminomethyluridine(34)-2'-O)- methyltransferase TrmL n=1 Tax=Haliea sp. E1-2-M8 TaxID=3064706 RepID=UPI00271B7C81|nr:tRNA (uridine(34)/cytosine(34)/5-carboxymethylaminomethyluridine(34)-2'-O)-methyltransferase TrmL [Haliea sp. E1-2-M8]MDO8860926.1 tRNA (uridine(34)/cytosine(34)/5-carboxymethylaminomethyluridine(34)-2'-O)-methyltransferase TrmL [Haliea sp. E1-2-M8]
MLNIVLYQPEIPPNTGNIIRLCANTGCQLHLVEPLGFALDDKRLRRAGLDYREFAPVKVHPDMASLLAALPESRLLAVSTRGSTPYHEVAYRADDAILLGPETRGLPTTLLDSLPPEQVVRIPMQENSRSLNLSNAAAILCYEALRQLGFPGLK